MRPVSDRFLRSLRGSHTMLSRATVLTTYHEGVGAAAAGVQIPIRSGDVMTDADADIRATLEITTTQAWGSLLSVYGNELFVERGLQLGAGVEEWVSQGYFRIDRVSQADAPDGELRVTGSDRMSGIVDGRPVAPIHFTAATTVGTAVAQLVLDIYPDATIVWDDATNLLPLGRAITIEDSRYQGLRDLVAAFAKVVWWNHRGELAIAAPPQDTDPVWDINAGAGGVLIQVDREQSREGVYNGAVVTGEGADTTAPARAVVVDDNPDSPTYWGGRFGKVPRFFASPLITTDAQAEAAGRTMLRAHSGVPYLLDFDTVPNPGLEPDDPIAITTRSGTELHVIRTLTTPLVPEREMSGTTRERTDVIVGVL